MSGSSSIMTLEGKFINKLNGHVSKYVYVCATSTMKNVPSLAQDGHDSILTKNVLVNQ